MSQQISLREAERKVFLTKQNDGLWDIFLGCIFLMLVIAPFLSASLGDFWSSVVFLPFWSLVYLAIWLTKKYVVTPRIGVVKYGPVRVKRLKKLSIVMISVNIIAFILGLVAATRFSQIPGQLYSIGMGIVLLIGFSFAAYLLNINRLYVYGLLVGLAPMVGESLWTQGYASHHGFPITFGVVSGTMILTGLTILVRLLRNNPVPKSPLGNA